MAHFPVWMRWLAGITALVCWSVGAQDTEQMVVVRRIVPANFHAHDFDPTEFQRLLESSATRAVLAEPRSTVSDILKKEFNISETWTPRVYKKLEEHVLLANGLNEKGLDLKPNKVLKLPDLPRTSEVYSDPKRTAPAQPKTSLWATWDNKIQAFIGIPRVPQAGPKTSKQEMQIRSLPASQLAGLDIPTGVHPLSFDDHHYQVLNEQMPVTFADAPTAAQRSRFLSAPERELVRRFISRPARTRPVLVIFDDAYPSQREFFHTAQFIIDASKLIRKKFALDDMFHGDSSDLARLEKEFRQGTIFCDADCEYPKLKTHAAMIEESLKELTQADESGRVEVIYLPINAGQLFSKEILTEMMRVRLLAESLADQLKLADHRAVDEEIPKPVYSIVEQQIQQTLTWARLSPPLVPFDGRAMTSVTDKAIIDSVVNFLWLYSAASERPHFLSMSWTTPNLKYSTLFRSQGYGLWLAAAGNDPSIDVNDNPRQFAARSSDPGDVIAVENVAAACPSSSLTSKVPVYGFAFPGRISPSLCGTSFSTPRVAWLLAAREAIKGNPVTPDTPAWYRWRAATRQDLMQLQQAKLGGEARYTVSLSQLLGEDGRHN